MFQVTIIPLRFIVHLMNGRFLPLHRVNKSFFHLVENDHADKQNYRRECRAVSQHPPRGVARAQEAGAKGFDDGSDGIDHRHPAVFLWYGRDRVDHRGDIHPQRNTEDHQVLQVAVLGGERRNDDAEPQPNPGHQQDEQRKAQGPQGKAHRRTAQQVINEETQEEHELDGKGDEVGKDDGERGYQAWEIHLAKQLRVGGESGGGSVETAGEIRPQHVAGHIKEQSRQGVGGQAGDVAEHHGEHHGGQQGLDEEPQRPKNGLFIARDEVTAHKEGDQIAVIPHLLQLQFKPLLARRDDQVPIRIRCASHICPGCERMVALRRGSSLRARVFSLIL